MSCKNLLLLGALLLAAIGSQAKTAPCELRNVEHGKVCVCTVEHCDYLDVPTLEEDKDFVLISSSKQGLRFSTLEGSFGTAEKYVVVDYEEPTTSVDTPANDTLSMLVDQLKAFVAHATADQQIAPASSITRTVTLRINREKQFQTMVGFGGSFTGAVSYLLEQYPQALQDHLYESYYSEAGLGFNLMRMTIGGSDFELEPWAYNEELEDDKELSAMDELNERDVPRVAQIKRLIEVSGVENLRIKGAAWSAPTWMKTNKKWTGFGLLKSEYYQTWADYHIKWIELMKENGLPIWAISTGNEPLNGIIFMYFVHFMSMGWTPQKQAVWLADHLGPTLRSSEAKDIVLFSNDDQRYTVPHWFKMMNRTRPNCLDYIDGTALHWYWDEIFDSNFIEDNNEYLPDKLLIVTESCIGDKPWQKAAPLLGSWERAEKYARAFLQNIKLGYHGWIDWNMVLDEQGGPNYVNNTVDAPVIANTTTFAEFYKQPMFYAMGHFSKLVPEDSIRIEAVPSNINLDSVSFLRPDKKIATVLFNSGRADLDINLVDSLKGTFTLNVPAKSISTLLHN